jgi:4-hydroxy-4-methyl-2-oxoglutarate aldolase
MDYAQAFRGIVTCDLSDACDALGIKTVTTGGIRPVYEGCRPAIGPITTVELTPEGKTSTVIGSVEAVLKAGPGGIVVFSSGGRMDLNTWGSIVGTVAVQARNAGVICDGVTRDVQTMRKYDFPTYARGTVVTSVRGRIGVNSMYQPIQIEGQTIHNGWICAADENGVLFFPGDRSDEIFEKAYKVAANEERTMTMIRQGADAVKIHLDMGYDMTWADQLKDHAKTAGSN